MLPKWLATGFRDPPSKGAAKSYRHSPMSTGNPAKVAASCKISLRSCPTRGAHNQGLPCPKILPRIPTLIWSPTFL